MSLKIEKAICLLFGIFTILSCNWVAENEVEYTFQGKIAGLGNGHLPAAEPPFSVNSVSPTNNATDVYRDVTIEISFSTAIVEASLYLNTNTSCTGKFQLSADSQFNTCVPLNRIIRKLPYVATYQIRPANMLSPTTTYYWRVLPGVKSIGNQVLSEVISGQFTTGTNTRPLLNIMGGDCSSGSDTVTAFKSATSTTESTVGPFTISGLVVTGFNRFGNLYLQKGNEAFLVYVSDSATNCTGVCKNNTQAYFGLHVGDEICIKITRGVEQNWVERVTDFSELRKTGVSHVNGNILSITNTWHSSNDNIRVIEVAGFLTKKVTGLNVNHILTFADTNTYTIRDENSGKFTQLAVGDYIRILTIANQFSTTRQIFLDPAVGMVEVLPFSSYPSYQVQVAVSGLEAGDTVKVQLNADYETTINTNGTHSFATNPAIQGKYLVEVSESPLGSVCFVSNGENYATANVTVELRCAKNPIFAFGGWEENRPAKTYPTYNGNQLTFKLSSSNVEDPLVSTDVGDNYEGDYNLFSGQRIDGREDRGFSFGITGTDTKKPIVADLPLNLSGKTNVRVRWVGRTWQDAGARNYGIRLEYSTSGCSGTFTAVTGAVYQRPPSATIYPHSQTFDNTITALDNQSNACLRWRYYYVSGGGNRPPMGVDDIFVTAN